MKSQSMQGKRVLVTGATQGMGWETALALADMGAEVVIIGRSESRAVEAVESIRAATGNPQVSSLLADLSAQADIRRVADEFKQKYARLDVLVNNVGAGFTQREVTVDGIEKTFALNHLGYFLITHLLLDTLKASAPARIVNVASGLYRYGKVDFDNLQGERSYFSFGAYNNSKLENILFTRELARRLQGTGVTVNALSPGVVATGMTSAQSGILARLGALMVSRIGQSPAQGASTAVYLASSPEVEGVSGEYYAKGIHTPLKPRALDTTVARRLWDVSADLVHVAR